MNDQIITILNYVAILIPAFLLVLTFRGLFRALVAKWMGDDTAYHDGFVSLNPLVHVDIMGLLIILFVLGVISGFLGKEEIQNFIFLGLVFIGMRWSYEIPINPSNFKNIKRGMTFTALAGPLGNFVLALIVLYFQKYFPFSSLPIYAAKAIGEVCKSTINFSIFFGVIHLLPLPPFDGFGVLEGLSPPSWRNAVNWLESKSLYIFVIFILFSDVFFIVLRPLFLSIYLLLTNLVF